MSNKRYYWLKLNEDFFEDDTISWIEEQENGKDYVLFYLKLVLKSLADDGMLVRYVGEKLIPYDVKALSRLTGTSTDTVIIAMKLFLEIGLISQMDSGEIYMNQIDEMIGTETDSARRMRRKRILDKKKQDSLPSPSQCDNNVQKCDEDVQESDTEIEKELELELEIDKERELQQEENSGNKKDDAAVADYKLAFNFYENNFGVLSPHIGEDLKSWVDETGIDLVLEALKKTIENQKNYSYAVGIMRNWAKNNIKTIDDVRAEEVAFNNKNKKRFNHSKPRKKETLPDWITDESPADEVIVNDTKEDGDLMGRLEKLRRMKVEE